MLQFCNITAGYYLNHWLLHTIFCPLSACWIKTNSMIYVPIMFCPLTVYAFKKFSTLIEILQIRLCHFYTNFDWDHFTVFWISSKLIELDRCCLRCLLANLKGFILVTDFSMIWLVFWKVLYDSKFMGRRDKKNSFMSLQLICICF